MNKKPDLAALEGQRALLVLQVNHFTRAFSQLENELAQLLHNVLFYKDSDESSRVAHAIYFSPDGFGGRQTLVNNAITEWLNEHPLGDYDFLGEWDCINHRLKTLRGVRNLIAHGSVQTVWVRGETVVRVMPPTFDPKVGDRVVAGGLPGMSADEVKHINDVLGAATVCVIDMAIVIAENDYGDSTYQRRFVELGEHRSRLNSLYPADQTPAKCKDPSPPSGE